MTRTEDMIFSTTSALLKDPNVFIADTWDPCDSTPHSFGPINIKTVTSADTITDASGKHMKLAQLDKPSLDLVVQPSHGVEVVSEIGFFLIE